MPLEPPETYVRKLKIAEDLAYRLQKPEWQTRQNREKLQALVKESLEFVQNQDVMGRLRRIDALVKAQERLEQLRELGTKDANQNLELIFYNLRVARQGR